MDTSIEKQIKEIEDEIFKTQKNKATEHHIGKLKAKMARLREIGEKRKSSGAKGKGFSIKKTGDATVGIVGFPSVGKSTLLNQLTAADSKVGDYDFTTLEAIPGMLKYKGAEIQILDLPGMIVGASKGKGRGREVISAVRSVDLLLLMIDAFDIDHLEHIEKELQIAGVRLNQKKPDVVITKKTYGGIVVNSTVPLTHLDELMVKSIASEFVINADITLREDLTEDQLIDTFAQNRVYISALVVINKTDLVAQDLLKNMISRLHQKRWDVCAISAKNKQNLDHLREQIFLHLRLIRIFMKPVGKKADYTQPMILREGQTVADACRHIHRDFHRNFRYASVWGPSAKHSGQKVGLEHVLKDQDVLTIVVTK
ncbi:MAG TPA: GTP-binding protein [Thermoplasmata archaeon]|jgi:small GTP-binding protein|nr:GTP-binding protein [Thermoplasmata archaeon]HIH28660.1 GTP-binding protein [Thermoplasmata archaeon]